MEKDINNKLLIQLWKEFLVLNNFSSVEDALEEFLKCCSETINSNIDEYKNMLELSNNNEEEEENYEEYPPVDSIDALLIKEVYDLEFELMKEEGKLEDAALESGDVAFVDDKDINRQLRLTNMLGSLYLTQNFYIKAIDCFSLVLKVNPSDKYDVKYKLGKAYLYSDMEEELLKLVKSYDYKKDEALLMLLVSNYITKGNIPLAHYYFECIKLINNKLVEHINASEIPVDLVEKTPKNLKNKLDRVIFAFRTIDQYILTLYHYDYMKYFANNKLPKEEFKKIDRKFIFERIKNAYEKRKHLLDETNSVRTFYSEADFIPGLIIDKFDKYVSIQFRNSGVEVFRQDIIEAVKKYFGEEFLNDGENKISTFSDFYYQYLVKIIIGSFLLF